MAEKKIKKGSSFDARFSMDDKVYVFIAEDSGYSGRDGNGTPPRLKSFIIKAIDVRVDRDMKIRYNEFSERHASSSYPEENVFGSVAEALKSVEVIKSEDNYHRY